jgi:hypothetical protein
MRRHGDRVRSTRFAVAFVLAFAVACSSGSQSSPPSSTSTSTTRAPTTTSSVPAGKIVVQVFFLDQDAFNVGRPPYVVPVDRVVDASSPEAGALDALFAGPTAEEGAGGLLFVPSGATGYADLRIQDGTARVRLVGGCSSGGSTFTVAEEIVATLRQFSAVQAVKILDPDGSTEVPDEPGDSIPVCLEP